jgi:hypothetical protein
MIIGFKVSRKFSELASTERKTKNKRLFLIPVIYVPKVNKLFEYKEIYSFT